MTVFETKHPTRSDCYNYSAFRLAESNLAWLRELQERWVLRRELSELSGKNLRDICLTHHDVQGIDDLPLNKDAAGKLCETAKMRIGSW